MSVETSEELLSWAREYASTVVADSSLEVDLSLVEWEVSHRAKRRAGATVYVRPPDASVGRVLDGDTPECIVRLTWAAYETLGDEAMAGVIRHELIHVEQVQRFGHTTHGRRFTRRAEALGAPRYCEPFAPARYHLHCDDCDSLVARRYRRSKLVGQAGRYRSGCCSAPLSVRENPARDQ